jgi:hypothetical protein
VLSGLGLTYHPNEGNDTNHSPAKHPRARTTESSLAQLKPHLVLARIIIDIER